MDPRPLLSAMTLPIPAVLLTLVPNPAA